MITEVLHSLKECQNEGEEANLMVGDSPASLFPILLTSQKKVADEVVWIEGTISVSCL